MQPILKISHIKWFSLSLSILFSVPIAFIAAILSCNVADKIYTLKNLALVASGWFLVLIWGVRFISDRFLAWLQSKQIPLSRRDYVLLLITLLSVIAAIYSGWTSYDGNQILNRFSSQFVVEITSPDEDSASGDICILEIKSQDGIKIRPKNSLKSEFLLTGGWASKTAGCQYFLQGGLEGSLKFHHVGSPGEAVQILFRENKDSGKALIRVNGEELFEANLSRGREGNKLVPVRLKFNSIEGRFWNTIVTAGLTAILAILAMILIPSVANISFPSQVESSLEHIRKYAWISLVPIAILIVIMFWPESAYRTTDVAYYLSLAKNLYHGNGYVNPDLSPNIYRGPVFPILISLSYTLFGEAFRSAVIMERLFWVFTILMSFLLGKQLFNHRVGVLASLFVLASSSINTAFYFVWTDGPLTFMLLTLQWLFWEAFSKRRGTLWYVLMGLTMGIAYLLKQTAIFIAPLPLLMWLAIADYRTTQTLKKLFIYYTIFALFIFGWMGYIYLVGGSPKQVAGDLNIALSILSRFSSILSAQPTVSTLEGISHSYSISFLQVFSTYYERDIVSFYKIAPIILVALGFTLFQAVVKKSKPDIQLSIGLLLFCSLIPIQVIANFGFRQNLYFYTVGMICFSAFLARLFDQASSKKISIFGMPIVVGSLILVQLSGSYFLNLRPIRIIDQKSLNYFNEYQTLAVWVNEHVKPTEKILIDERDGNILHILTNENRVFEIINTCRGEVAFWPAVACTPPYISFWIYRGTTNPDDPRDVLHGISEPALLSTIQEKNVQYILVTPRIYSLYFYLRVHPDFEKAADLGDFAIFRINHPVRAISNYPNIKSETCVGAGTPEYLKNLQVSNPARYEARVRNEIGPWMGLSKQDLESFQNWDGCQFKATFPGEYQLPSPIYRETWR